MVGLQVRKDINEITDVVVNEIKRFIEKEPKINLIISNPQFFGTTEMYDIWLQAISEDGRVLHENKRLYNIPKEVADNLISRRSIFVETLKGYGIHGKIRYNGNPLEF